LFHHFWLSVLEVLKALSFCEPYMKIFYGIKLYFSYLTILHRSSMCSSFLYVWNVLTFWYTSLPPWIFALGLFWQKVYEVVLLRFDNPFCVEVFCLPKESKKIFVSIPLFYSFKNSVVHQVAITFGDHTMNI
jgi:hypothetical protein